MPFAPHEIENKKFVVALRGYATDEVDAFLRAVAADYKSVLDGAQGHLPVAELENVLRAAHEQAIAITARAGEEAAEIRRLAEEDAQLVREAAAAELVEVERAERRLAEREEEVARRTSELRRVEARLQKLQFVSEFTAALGSG